MPLATHPLHAALAAFLASDAAQFPSGIVETARNLERAFAKLDAAARAVCPAVETCHDTDTPDVPASLPTDPDSPCTEMAGGNADAPVEALDLPLDDIEPMDVPLPLPHPDADRARTAAVEERATNLLKKIRFAIRDGQDSAAMEKELLFLVDHAPEWEQKLQTTIKEANNFRKERIVFASLLRKGACHPDTVAYWRDIPTKRSWFITRAQKDLRWHVNKTLERISVQKGTQAAAAFQNAIQRNYPDLVGVMLPEVWAKPKSQLPTVPEDTLHTLPHLPPSREWRVYIDETGLRFSADESGAPGKVVAVCLPHDVTLPDLPGFHCTEKPAGTVIDNLCTLLRSPAGIVGFSSLDMGIQGSNGWLQAVRELIKWVWRLLPLPEEHSTIHVYMEQRTDYTPDLQTSLSCDMLMAELTGEDLQRSRKLRIASLTFLDKKDPQIAWADVAAYCWGSPKAEIRHALRQSGLEGTSLVTLEAPLPKVCEKILANGIPTGAEWQALISHADAAKPRGLASHALEHLQARCRKDPALWVEYVRAMHQYLLGKDYTLSVLDRMGGWFPPMKDSDLTTEFCWQLSRLAHLNHLGDADSEELLSVKCRLAELTPSIRTIDATAALHAALRLAVSDANAFDFRTAEARLATWNPLAGGSLTGTALWDGKILSSLGQYRAFQNDATGATYFFRQALDCFATLPPEEAQRQAPQTRTYLAIAEMDRPDADEAAVRTLVEEALGCDISKAVATFAQPGCAGCRYQHHLLVRYLARRGSEAERAPYLKQQAHWTRIEAGFQKGHPWPLIQYYRWLMTDPEDRPSRKAIANTLGTAMGPANMPTLEVILYALALSMGLFSADNAAVCGNLLKLEARIPAASPIIRQMLVPGWSDPWLATRLLPFNYC